MITLTASGQFQFALLKNHREPLNNITWKGNLGITFDFQNPIQRMNTLCYKIVHN